MTPERPVLRWPAPEPLAELLAGVLVGLVLLAWVAAWRGTLAGGWPQALLTQSGQFAYLLLGASCLVGPLIGTRWLPGWLNASVKTGWHGLLSGFALTLGAIHGLFSLVGERALPLAGALVPGLASRQTLEIGLGTAALWLLALVYLSWALRRRLGLRAARALHLLAYPAFMAATLHGLWLGHGGLQYPLLSVGVGLALAARLVTLARR